MIVAEREMPMTQCTRTRFAYKHSIFCIFVVSTSDSQLHFLRQTHVRMTIPSAADAAFVRGLECIADEGDRSG